MAGKADNQKTVKKAMGGGLGAMMTGAPMVAPSEMAPTARAPMRPTMSLRRKAMAARNARQVPVRAIPSEMPPMKKGGSAEGTKAEEKRESKAEQKKEMKEGHSKNYKTGGVVKGQAGFKDGGSTGDVKLGNGGGYKKGGASKKFANGGSAIAMPQGNKKQTPPVAINMLSGTYKKGGKVKKMAQGGSDDESFQDPSSQLVEIRRMKNLAKGEGAVSDAKREMVDGLGLADKIGNFYNRAKAAIKGPSVTDSKTTVSRTVTPPAKKHGGRC
jgi:hypothetical protein